MEQQDRCATEEVDITFPLTKTAKLVHKPYLLGRAPSLGNRLLTTVLGVSSPEKVIYLINLEPSALRHPQPLLQSVAGTACP